MIVYKCPTCGADIQYTAGEDSIQCKYCDSVISIGALAEYEKDLNKQKPDSFNWREYDKNGGNGDWSDAELSMMQTYRCAHCGGEIIGDGSTIATTCPYCDNPVVMGSSIDGILRPDYVIPFEKKREEVFSAYRKFLSGRFLLPHKFKSVSPDDLKGIYVPFWLFDCDSNGSITLNAVRIHRWSDSRYNYTKTDYYNVVREGKMGFERVPVDGSSKMDDTFMESIEPYDFREALDFNSAYLAGFFADRYDVDVTHSIQRANQRIRNSTIEMLRSTVNGYNTVTVNHSDVHIDEGDIHYALLPVWMMNTKYGGKTYTFAMNGQTGKMVGELPIDKRKLALTCVGTFLASLAIAVLVIAFLL